MSRFSRCLGNPPLLLIWCRPPPFLPYTALFVPMIRYSDTIAFNTRHRDNVTVSGSLDLRTNLTIHCTIYILHVWGHSKKLLQAQYWARNLCAKTATNGDISKMFDTSKISQLFFQMCGTHQNCKHYKIRSESFYS